MSATNRAKLIGKLHTALKKHYTPVVPDSRPLLEHVLYGSLLQDATYELADEGMAKCEQDFFDWNELRVTTVTELAQVLSNFPDPTKAAQRLKGNLQGIFEEFYTFDLDHLRKENLGKAVSKFEKMENMTPFVLSYTVQNGLGGHSIPVDYAALVIMLVTEIVSQSEAADSRVPGLERAIAKNKGVEFGSLLHQCAVALMNDPKDKTARAVLDATSKKSSERLDEWLASKSAAKKRVRKRKAAEKAAAKLESEKAESGSQKTATKKSKAAEEKAEKAKIAALEAAKKKSMAAKTASAESSAAKKAAAAKPAAKAALAKKKSPAKKSPAKKSPVKKSPVKKSPLKKSPAKKSPVKKSPAKKAPAKKAPAKKVTKKKAAPKKAATKKATTKKASAKKSPAKKSPAKKSSAKKADNRKLTKKKPR